MSGYIELNRTGFAPFDDSLALIEDAGTAYHHTSQWSEDGWDGERPYLDQINESIAFAANAYLDLKEQIATLTRQRDNLLAQVNLAVNALECIAGRRMFIDNLASNVDIAVMTLDAIKESEK